MLEQVYNYKISRLKERIKASVLLSYILWGINMNNKISG